MIQRTLGHSGIAIAPLVLGGNVFGWTVDEPTGLRLLDAFVDAGFNAIDTADVYSVWVPGHRGGESETAIGNWLKRSGKRSKVVLATKVGMEMPGGRKGLSRARIFEAVEDSLRRLQTDTIDLYQAHADDPNTPLEETLAAFAALMQQGKVRAIGASNYSAPRLAEALAVSKNNNLPRYETLQPQYSLVEREGFEAELAPLCQKENLGVLTYFPLAAGFLTGKYRSEADLAQSARGGSVKKYLNPRGHAILRALDDAARQHNATAATVALAWQLTRPGVTAPISSATSMAQLNQLLKATDLRLDPATIKNLNQASQPVATT